MWLVLTYFLEENFLMYTRFKGISIPIKHNFTSHFLFLSVKPISLHKDCLVVAAVDTSAKFAVVLLLMARTDVLT